MNKTRTQSANSGHSKDKSVDEIIAQGKHLRPGLTGTFVLTFLTGLLLYSSFTPLDFGPLAWIALVPLLLLIRPEHSTRWMYRTIFAAGFLFWLASLQWMRLGDPTMYIALFAMSFYLSLYWVGFIWLTRISVHRFKAPLVIAVPVFWVGLEYLRAYLFSGFSWYYLGHTQHRWIEIIQISDIFGTYGVSFLVALANAAIAQAIPVRLFQTLALTLPDEQQKLAEKQSSQKQLYGVITSLLIITATVGYGYLRRSQAAFVTGPRVGLIQGDFVASLDPAHSKSADEIFSMHRALTGQVIPYQPDLIVWPEAMFGYSMFTHEAGMTDEQLSAVHTGIGLEYWKAQAAQIRLKELAEGANAAMCVGISVLEARPNEFLSFNSAVFVEPDTGIQDRYDKIHRVLFGEYIPFKDSLPFIQALTPYRGDFGIQAGKSIHVFKHKQWKFVPIICFEDTVPQLVREMVSQVGQKPGEGVDCLVNMTNDGWFHGSSELDQHLITAKFRCVETRTPMVRAVNTGISAIIDGDGVVRDPQEFIDFDSMRAHEVERTHYRDPKSGRFLKQLNCALVGDVPLDSRTSLYVSWGDWFGIMCLIATVATLLQGVTSRFRKPPSKN